MVRVVRVVRVVMVVMMVMMVMIGIGITIMNNDYGTDEDLHILMTPIIIMSFTSRPFYDQGMIIITLIILIMMITTTQRSTTYL